jgi:hypothetical protein
MGLKTNNYFIKSMQENLSEAYAIVRSYDVDRAGNGNAIIAVHRTRDLAINPDVTPFETQYITFISDRTTSDRETIYKTITQPYTEKEFNPDTGEYEDVTKYPLFYGWENDIVNNEE